MRSPPTASILLAVVLGVVFTGTELRARATQPHVDGALQAFDDVRRAHPSARLSPGRLADAPPTVRAALAPLERQRAPRPEDLLLEVALEDVLRAASSLPQNAQGHRPEAPTVQGAVLSMWTHLTLPALVGNLALLLWFGAAVERRWGRRGPPLLFFLAGLGGLLAHHLVAPTMGPLVGASGGVFGLLGAQLVPAPDPAMSRLGPIPAWSAAMVLFGVEAAAAAFGLTPNMSHAAHVGGLFTGFVSAFALARVGLLSERPAPEG